MDGTNLGKLKTFLNLLSGRMCSNEDKPAEFQIDETYSVPVRGALVLFVYISVYFILHECGSCVLIYGMNILCCLYIALLLYGALMYLYIHVYSSTYLYIYCMGLSSYVFVYSSTYLYNVRGSALMYLYIALMYLYIALHIYILYGALMYVYSSTYLYTVYFFIILHEWGALMY